MTRLELAQRLFGYDPETSPQQRLDDARRSVIEAELIYDSEKARLAELDDEAVYEWQFDGDRQSYRATKREIVKRTPKQIRLARNYRDTRQTYLPRQRLEAGEIVGNGKGWWLPDFAFGWVIRPKLKEQLAKSVRWLESSRNELERVERAIINDEIFLTPSQQRTIEVVIQMAKVPRRPPTPSVDWRKEGF